MQAEARDDVRAALLSVVPPHLGVVPGEEGLQSVPACGEVGGGDPAAAPGAASPGAEFGDGESGKASARRAYASATAEPGTAM